LPENKGELAYKVAMIRRNLLAAPFELAFCEQAKGTVNPAVLTIRYRSDEAMYIQSQPDRVTVIFSILFKEEVDRIIGKVFLQEFVDARRQAAIQQAPPVQYSKEPPLEIRSLVPNNRDEGMGYVTFVLFPRHFQEPEVGEATISKIQLFRDYLHYHIKCSKAYMHSRMRNRVDDFLKVLNRAKPERTEERKSVSGRTFHTQD